MDTVNMEKAKKTSIGAEAAINDPREDKKDRGHKEEALADDNPDREETSTPKKKQAPTLCILLSRQ